MIQQDKLEAYNEYFRESQRGVLGSEREQFKATNAQIWRLKELELTYHYKLAEGEYRQLVSAVKNPDYLATSLAIRRSNDDLIWEAYRYGIANDLIEYLRAITLHYPSRVVGSHPDGPPPHFTLMNLLHHSHSSGLIE